MSAPIHEIVRRREETTEHSVRHQWNRGYSLSDPFTKLSNVGGKPPDILSDTSEIEVIVCLIRVY